MVVTEDDLALFNDSLEYCRSSPEFLTRFYEHFIATSSEVASLFAATDFAHQRRVLGTALYTIMGQCRSSSVPPELEAIARRHSRSDRNVRPELYDLWLDCLLQAVREFDPRFTARTEHAWRVVLSVGIAFMKSRY
ncbi:MAG TPA: globin [Candidatus Binatia bacterium]|nr:globin [Candidatus Binatia bacterium]